jgi:hypothetical protein
VRSKIHTKFLVGKPERGNLEDLGTDGRIILNLILTERTGGEKLDLFQDSGQSVALVNIIMNICWIP